MSTMRSCCRRSFVATWRLNNLGPNLNLRRYSSKPLDEWADLPESVPKPKDVDTIDLFSAYVSEALSSKKKREPEDSQRSRALIIHGLPNRAMADQIVEVMTKRYGSTVLGSRADKKPERDWLLLIEFPSISEARRVLTEYWTDQGSLYPSLSNLDPRPPASYARGSRFRRPPAHPSDTLFIGNIPYKFDPAPLLEHLLSFGPIKRHQLKEAANVTTPGYAHVQFDSLDSAVRAYSSCRFTPLRARCGSSWAHFIHPEATSADSGDDVRNLFVDYRAGRIGPEGIPSRNLFFSGWMGRKGELKDLIYKEMKRGVDPVMRIAFVPDKGTGALTSGYIELISMDAARRIRALEGTVCHEADGRPFSFNVKYALTPILGRPVIKDKIPIHPDQQAKIVGHVPW